MNLVVVSTEPAEIARRLREALKVTGRSKRQVELATGMSKGYLSRLTSEDGYGEVSVQMLATLAGELGVNFEWLAAGNGAMKPHAPDAPERFVVYDERYPNLTDAVIAARALKYSEAAISLARDRALSGDDPPPQAWLKRIEIAEDDLRRRGLALAQDVERDTKMREVDRKRAAEMEQLTKPKLPKRRST